MPANIINSGTPLAPGASAPLWTAQCDNSANLVNTSSPNDLLIPLTGASGPGTIELPTWVQALDQIEQVNITGTMKGKRGDTISVNLKHETYGVIPLIANHGILGNLTNPYPLPPEVRTFLFGEAIPAGYTFYSWNGPGSSQFLTLPESINPNNYYYYNNYYQNYAGLSWQVSGYQPEGSPVSITVPAHRYPYTPDYNYDNAPGNAMVTGAVPLILIYRGFRYIMTTQAGGEPSVVSSKVFSNIVYDNGTQNTRQGYYSTGEQPWNDFNNNFGPYSSNSAFSEGLWNNYGAHDWLVTSVTRLATNYIAFLGGISYATFTRVVDTYTVQFIKWSDITWAMTPLAQVTWQAIFPPSANYQFYPPDYYDWINLSERSEALSLAAQDWKGKAADGVWTLEFIGGSAAPPAAYSPTVTPATVRIDNLAITIKFKGNSAYVSNAITPSNPSAGTIVAATQGNLRANGDDRAFIGILCGIQGSTSMGILCGYSVLRTGRNGEIYNVSYFVATTCNINHVNMTRLVKSISYFAKDWGDRPFSTKGDAGEAFVLGPVQHRIYPVRGQIGLQVQLKGNQLTFMMMGQYPVLVFLDPTVPLVNTFSKISLNA